VVWPSWCEYNICDTSPHERNVMGVKFRCRSKISFFCGLLICVLFCQKFLVCSVCNGNVFRNVTTYLTARVQMKQISTCTLCRSPSLVNQKVSGKMFLNFVMLATLIIVHAVTHTNHQQSCDGQFHHHVKSHTQGFNTKFLKVNVCEWSNAIMCFVI
jgi:hypothetical protein